jgi:hypothetical protein
MDSAYHAIYDDMWYATRFLLVEEIWFLLVEEIWPCELGGP